MPALFRMWPLASFGKPFGPWREPWARLNCENTPVIPLWPVRSNLNDPRRIPYLLVWKDERHGGEITARLSRYTKQPCGAEANGREFHSFAAGLADASAERWAALLLVCSYCNTPRRHVYGWEWDSSSGWSNRARRISSRCR